MMKKQKLFRNISQHQINAGNFIIAALALIFAIPGAINQYNQYLHDKDKSFQTKVVYYSPNISNFKNATNANCIASAASNRSDAYRCFSGDTISDPCFYTENDNDLSSSYFYCPTDFPQSDKGILLKQKITKQSKAPIRSEMQSTPQQSWLINLSDGSICRRLTGTVEIAFDSHGAVFACRGGHVSYAADNVTEKQGKYYVSCKQSSSDIFSKCLISEIVY